MKHLFLAAAAALALAALPALASEATFERTLSVSGRVELSVWTGSGNVHITRGSPGSHLGEGETKRIRVNFDSGAKRREDARHRG
jgi:hypothetical protein